MFFRNHMAINTKVTKKSDVVITSNCERFREKYLTIIYYKPIDAK